MTPDAWHRLAFVAACSAYVVFDAVVWVVLGWPFALVTIVGGSVLALALSAEMSAPKDDTVTVGAALAAATTNALDDELQRRARRGDVPVATRKGRPLASVDGDDAS